MHEAAGVSLVGELTKASGGAVGENSAAASSSSIAAEESLGEGAVVARDAGILVALGRAAGRAAEAVGVVEGVVLGGRADAHRVVGAGAAAVVREHDLVFVAVLVLKNAHPHTKLSERINKRSGRYQAAPKSATGWQVESAGKQWESSQRW